MPSYVVTLNSNVQNLGTLVTAAGGNGHARVKMLQVQADVANVGAYWIEHSHASSGQDPAANGLRFPVPVDEEPHAPWNPIDGDMRAYLKLSELYVDGTNADKLRVTYIEGDGFVARGRDVGYASVVIFVLGLAAYFL